jgi:DNA-binding response OmpR family regulator
MIDSRSSMTSHEGYAEMNSTAGDVGRLRPGTGASLTRRRILIVEDDPFIAMDIEAAILDDLVDRHDRGDRTEVIVVDSLRAAQSHAEIGVHCALLDVDVVGGKTFDLALQLHQRGTPIAFVSGSLPSDLPHELHGVAFVLKPFRARDITGFINAALARSVEGC